MEKFDLLRRAKADIRIADLSLLETSDEVFIDMAAYHTQQVIEKVFKYNLINNNVKYPKTHDFEHLCDIADNNNVSYPEWISDNAVKLTLFESETRYGSDLIAARRTVVRFLSLAKKYFDETQKKQQELQNLESSLLSDTEIPKTGSMEENQSITIVPQITATRETT